jgi:hypothetical protein
LDDGGERTVLEHLEPPLFRGIRLVVPGGQRLAERDLIGSQRRCDRSLDLGAGRHDDTNRDDERGGDG